MKVLMSLEEYHEGELSLRPVLQSEKVVRFLAGHSQYRHYFYAYISTDLDEIKYHEAMDDFTKNTTPGGTWICDGTSPCISDGPCDHPNHM